MSPQVIAFMPTSRTVHQRVKDFGELGRRVGRKAYPIIDFDEDVWDVTDYCQINRNVKVWTVTSSRNPIRRQ
jgi:hypothetical protein